MEFPDKPAALLGALLNRFGVGLVIGCVRLSWPGWAVGLLFGLLLSLPDAIITRAYAPILLLWLCGWASHRRVDPRLAEARMIVGRSAGVGPGRGTRA